MVWKLILVYFEDIKFSRRVVDVVLNLLQKVCIG